MWPFIKVCTVFKHRNIYQYDDASEKAMHYTGRSRNSFRDKALHNLENSNLLQVMFYEPSWIFVSNQMEESISIQRVQSCNFVHIDNLIFSNNIYIN